MSLTHVTSPGGGRGCRAGQGLMMRGRPYARGPNSWWASRMHRRARSAHTHAEPRLSRARITAPPPRSACTRAPATRESPAREGGAHLSARPGRSATRTGASRGSSTCCASRTIGRNYEYDICTCSSRDWATLGTCTAATARAARSATACRARGAFSQTPPVTQTRRGSTGSISRPISSNTNHYVSV